jgi:hypothetical protein
MHYYFDRETTMRLLKRVIFPFRIAVAFGILAYPSGMALAQPAQDAQAPTPRERELLDRIRALEERLSAVEARLAASPTAAQVSPAALQALSAAASQSATAQPERSATGDSLSLPGFAAGTTVNFLVDGYYEYNFNQPVGRVNLLRAYDPTSNSFTLNQAAVIVERAPDPSQGRRFGLRLDLMFGQTTESLSGNPANEARTAPYRNVFQAYGTYIAPLGRGLTVDFGRFASSLGFEGSFAKDQINYTRSLLFTALPFYHMGFRTSYKLTDKVTATWLLINGINQMEDFNGFKSNHLMLSAALSKNLTWTGSYYFGQESRDFVQPAVVSNLPPPAPTQPGLSTSPVSPAPNGRTHIADTNFIWNASSKLTFVGEGDYIVSRAYADSYPAHLAGGAGYMKYQLLPKFSLAGRFEYLSDRGGYFSGTTQALKEVTITATYQPAGGFQLRWEFRRDYSNQPFFLSHTSGALRRDQNTALLGLLFWFGGKQGAW